MFNPLKLLAYAYTQPNIQILPFCTTDVPFNNYIYRSAFWPLIGRLSKPRNCQSILLVNGLSKWSSYLIDCNGSFIPGTVFNPYIQIYLYCAAVASNAAHGRFCAQCSLYT